MRLLATFALLAWATVATAAPFCVVQSYGTQCWYYTHEDCVRAAGSSGACVINQQEAQAPAHSAPFCVVSSTGTQCMYYDAASCRRAAAEQNGVCAANPNR